MYQPARAAGVAIAARPRGEAVVTAVLTEAMVREIRRAHAAGESINALSRRLGVGWSTVQRVVKRLTWKHVTVTGTVAKRGAR